MENSEVQVIHVVSYSSLRPQNMTVLKLSLLYFMGKFIASISVSGSYVIFNVQTSCEHFSVFRCCGL